MLATQSDTTAIEMQKYPSLYASPFEDTMFLSDVVIGPHDGDPPVKTEELLRQYSLEYVLRKVRHMLWVRVVPEERGLYEAEDIAAEIHIHFWEVLEDKAREPIRYHTTYLARMIQNKICDEMRKRNRQGSPQPFSVLPTGVIQEVNAMESWSSSMSDPAFEYEHKLSEAQFLHKMAYAVSKLPPRQKLAMTCDLLEKAENLSWMTDALIKYGVDTQVQWPTDKKAKQGLQANLPPARLAVAQYLHINASALT